METVILQPAFASADQPVRKQWPPCYLAAIFDFFPRTVLAGILFVLRTGCQLSFLRTLFTIRFELVAENLTLRPQDRITNFTFPNSTNLFMNFLVSVE